MVAVNYWAVLAAAASAFVLGGLWYSVLFGKVWSREAGVTEAMARQGHPAKVFGGAFVLSLFAAYAFATFLGTTPWKEATLYGFTAGLFWVATSFGINYLFAERSFKLWLVDGGYHTLQFTLYGLIIGLWR